MRLLPANSTGGEKAMKMNVRLLSRIALYSAGMAIMMSAFSSSADAGCFRSLFRGRQCQNCYVQPSSPAATPSGTASAGSQYQSFSYEPGSSAQQLAPSYSSSASGYQGAHRVERGSSVPNMFRADRKVLGLSSH